MTDTWPQVAGLALILLFLAFILFIFMMILPRDKE